MYCIVKYEVLIIQNIETIKNLYCNISFLDNVVISVKYKILLLNLINENCYIRHSYYVYYLK